MTFTGIPFATRSAVPEVPLIKPRPKQVPFGFSSTDRPVMIERIQLAKERDNEDCE